MAELRNSSVLESIFKQMQTVSGKHNNAMTAEKFLMALFQYIGDSATGSEEVNKVIELFVDYQIDVETTYKKLIIYMQGGTPISMYDGLYMQKKLYEARNQAEKQGKLELTADVLVACIFKNPSDNIKQILFSTKNEKDCKQDIDSLLKMVGMKEDKSQKSVSENIQESNNSQEISSKTKLDMSDLVSDAKRIRTELQKHVFGQDNAIHVFTTGCFQANMLSRIDKSRKRPRATFLFAGPPGVGKTFLAEKAAEVLGLPFMRFDMSEYSDKEANIEFCGSDEVYKNAKAGNVTSFVAKNPKCVLLFDEIEKAHLCVIHLFLQMLDAGRLRDNFSDQEVSFADAIIILTTNAGKQLYEESASGDLSTVSRKVIIKALQKDINPQTGTPYFPAAICSRFASGNVVMFNHMGVHNLRTIAKKEMERHAKNLEQETGITIQIDERVYTALLLAEGSGADARTVRSRAETFFNDELYELLRLIDSEKVKTDIGNIEKIQVGLDFSQTSEKMQGLFYNKTKPQILILAGEQAIAECKRKISDADIWGVQEVGGAVDVLKEHNIDFIMLDMKYGAKVGTYDILNLEDVVSPARDLFKLLREKRNELPIFLLEENSLVLSEEEKISFLRQGVRGIFCLTDSKEIFSEQVDTIASSLHQQASMMKLAKENKVISFETAQTISKDGKWAEIKLFDFEMMVAVESEDAKNVLSAVSKPNVRFDEVIGAEEAKKELTYFVEYLKNPKKYMGTGVKAPKGVLLYGPPGTGKTLLAKAMASEAGVTFIAAEGNQFLKKYVGEGSEKVHELFKTARKYAPSILFIDEIDAIAKERKGAGTVGAGTEETLTAFLTEMDGFINDPSKPVFVLAATNFEVEKGSNKSLDAALLRRFDRRIYIGLPGKEERIRFLNMKIGKNSALQISDKQVNNIAMRATGMSLAELDSAVELALRSAIREGSVMVTDAILEEAFETFNSGEVKVWDVSQLERVARHEAGHAFLCWQSGETPSYLTIVARGNHGGYMQHAEQEGKTIYTKEELLDKIRISLGGRAAEIVYYGTRDGISTGARGDLVSASNMAKQIICSYGMDDEFGLAVITENEATNGAMAVEIRHAINRILKEQMEKAICIIQENKTKMDALVSALMSENHMTDLEIEEALNCVE